MDYVHNLFRARYSMINAISKTSDEWIEVGDSQRYYVEVMREVELAAEIEFLQTVVKLLWSNYEFEVVVIKIYSFNLFTKINAETIEDEIVNTCEEMFNLLNSIEIFVPLESFISTIDSILFRFNTLCSLREIRRRKLPNLKKKKNNM